MTNHFTYELTGNLGQNLHKPTEISANNSRYLVSHDGIADVARLVQEKTKSKITKEKVRALTTFIKNSITGRHAVKFFGVPYDAVVHQLADGFVLSRRRKMDEQAREKALREGIHTTYQRREAVSMSSAENPFKRSAKTNRPSDVNVDDLVGSAVPDIEAGSSSSGTQSGGSGGLHDTHQTIDSINLHHTNIYLDSRYKVPHDDPYRLTWNIHNSSHEGSIGDIRLHEQLVQVIEMGISSFWVPIIDTRDSYQKRILLGFREFSNQSTHYTEYNGTPSNNIQNIKDFHFEFKIDTIDDKRMYLVPLESKYRFSKPFNHVNTLTAEFYTPSNRLEIPRECYEGTLTRGVLTTIETPEEHGLIAGDIVMLHEVDVGNITFNNYLNDPKGIIVNTVPTSTTFTVDYDTSTGTQDSSVYVCIEKYRIMFKMNFVSLES